MSKLSALRNPPRKNRSKVGGWTSRLWAIRHTTAGCQAKAKDTTAQKKGGMGTEAWKKIAEISKKIERINSDGAAMVQGQANFIFLFLQFVRHITSKS